MNSMVTFGNGDPIHYVHGMASAIQREFNESYAMKTGEVEMFFGKRINPNNGYATKRRNDKIAFHTKKMRTQDRLRAKLEAKK